MRIAVVGCRTYNDKIHFESIMDAIKEEITVIISGGAGSIDKMAEAYANKHNISIEIYLPDWSRYGRSIRNKTIVEKSEAVLAFWDGHSKGTKSTIDIAKKMNRELVIVDI